LTLKDRLAILRSIVEDGRTVRLVPIRTGATAPANHDSEYRIVFFDCAG
jgi:hypothetical protein